MDRQNNSNERGHRNHSPQIRVVHKTTQTDTGHRDPIKHVPHGGHAGRDSHPPRRRSAPFSPERAREREHHNNRAPQDLNAPRTLNLPPVGENNIRIIPLGGVEEVGMNMTAIEYKNDIIVMDIGFKFKDQDTPGIDYILPNTKYLEERKDKIRAVIITHGHLDHIGGIPYIMERIGNPPLYTRNLTGLMIKKRQTEFPHLPMIDYKIVDTSESVTLGEMKIKFFGVTHSIPDCLGVCIKTPYGNIINPGDYKLEHTDGVASEGEDKIYGELAKEKTLLLLTDSTNIENPGFSTPEVLVHKNLADIIQNTKGRLIMSMFSSHVTRIAKLIEACEKNNKKVVIEGRSMKNNVEICKEAKIIEMKKDTLISSAEIPNYPPDRIVILATGAQGDEFAALSRLANKSHKSITLTKNDTVVLSSSIIPGNEKSVQAMKDNIARTGAKIVHYRTSEVFIHSTGHGNRGEIEWLHKKLMPKFFVPIHGNHYMLRLHGELAMGLGMKEENIIIPDNGSLIDIVEEGTKIKTYKEKAPSSLVMVDGFAIGDMQEVVLRDRQMLSQDGMFVIIASVNTMNGKLRKSPDIISRGFVYLRENQELLRQARIIIKKTIEDNAQGMNPINFDFIKDVVTDNIARFLFQKTAKRPIVIPVILGV